MVLPLLTLLTSVQKFFRKVTEVATELIRILRSMPRFDRPTIYLAFLKRIDA